MNTKELVGGALWKKLMMLFLTISIVPVGIISYLTYRSAKIDLQRKIYNELTAIATAKKDHITQLLKLRQEQLLLIARNHLYITALEKINQKHPDAYQLKADMKNALKHQSEIVESFYKISIADANGKIVASTHTKDLGRDVSKNDVFIHGMKGIYLKDFHFEPYIKEKMPVYTIAAPIVDATNNKPQGVVISTIKGHVITGVLTDYSGLGKTGEILLVKKFGDEVVFLNNPRFEPDAALKRKLSIHAEHGLPIILGASGQEGIMETTDYRGVAALSAYRHIAAGKWGLVSKIDASEAFLPLTALRNRVWYLGISTILIVAAIAYFSGVKITRPLVKLALASEKISEGDLKVKLDVVNTRDEIGILSRSFSVMTVKLRELYASLEKKVEDRTYALEAANKDLKKQQEFELAYNEIVTIINASMGTEKLLSESLNKISSFSDSQTGIIYLYDEKERMLKMSAGYSVYDNDITSKMFGLGVGIPGQVAQEKKYLLIRDIPADTLFKIRSGIGDALPRSIGCFPIVLQERLLGVLVLASLKDYPDEMIEFVNTVSQQLAVAVSNLQAYQLIQRQTEELQQKNEELASQNEELHSQAEELRVQQVALEEKNREVDMANRAKSDFLANMSHELRTPLNSIIGFSEVLEDQSFGTLNEKQKKYVQNIHTSGMHLLQLINDILDLSKVEAGKIQLQYEEFSLPEILHDIKSLIKTQADKKNILFGIETDERVISIGADKQKFKQIMLNLLSNAVKFTPKGGKITVSVQSVNGCTQISVSDTGIGIKQENIGRIFEKFQQIDSKTAREYGGTGLGLALSRKFVEMHGGKIWVESEYGKGSTFTFTIPLKLISKTPAEEITLVKEREQEGENALILVVEDDPKSSELLKIFLTQKGYKVATAFNGDEAITKAKELKPLAITLDIVLPFKSGWDVLKELKKIPETQNIPVIVISIIDEKKHGFSLGALDYLMKPVNKEELLMKLEYYGLTVKPEGGLMDILVIDDERETVEMVSNILESRGYRVGKAYGGHEGICLAVKKKFDLIILDLIMPEIDGFDVVDELKKHDISKNVPIVIFTAKDLIEEDYFRLRQRVELIAQKGKFSKEELLTHIEKIKNMQAEKTKEREKI
ncbi:MAG: hypothetical protein A2Y08_02275 [Planctomycetes bacterium GWA2_40_7]|nr:MAG: hypothetical protein A2Y08_02275 [Planctomycetes bacterium GWA2_40_7]OHB74150.1 MAG: hypothetical protein A2W17_01775 [Planctomycetes bacterium RBG_16_41_13]